ncbi:esterase/lipase family protein [Streptomyces sp. NPDC057579]|uniref:esterase/lipase family protein n=1 Tax=Streptomyces sp. NPDC057579 TaxID=3346172 RepID=UPI00369FF53D
MAKTAEIHVSFSLLDGLQEASQEQLTALAAELPRDIWFTTPLTGPGEAPRPDFTWTLRGSYPYEDTIATGTAHVYLATDGRRRIQRPLIFADGFNYGPSDLDGLWTFFDKQEGGRFLTSLREAGHDVILLGFDERHTYIQANAGVATACIERAIAEREGDQKLVVGGVSMGGTITRYALARMQHNGDAPQTRTYFSWDTPHLGAWIPLILQQMAHFFEDYTDEAPGEPKQAELLRSPAAQQLLWAWVENSKYQGPVATASPLRTQFLKDLAAVGNFPTDMARVGVANGHGAGTGLKLTPGEIAFEYKKEYNVASATARIQPDLGDKQPIGGMHIALAVRRSSTTSVPALDGAPGGTLASFGLVAKKLGIEVDPRFDYTCFVPSVSATALHHDPLHWEDVDFFTDLSAPDSGPFDLDAFRCADDNSPHSEPRPELTEWLINHI